MMLNPHDALGIGRIVRCLTCGEEFEVWPNPETPDKLPAVVHPNQWGLDPEYVTHEFVWPH